MRGTGPVEPVTGAPPRNQRSRGATRVRIASAGDISGTSSCRAKGTDARASSVFTALMARLEVAAKKTCGPSWSCGWDRDDARSVRLYSDGCCSDCMKTCENTVCGCFVVCLILYCIGVKWCEAHC